MQASYLLGVGVVLGAVLLSVPAPRPMAQAPTGHLVLVLVGDCQRLEITAAVRKPDPFGGTAKGLASDFRVQIADAQGSELGSYLLDLSRFDLDPAHLGLPDRSTGDVVQSSRIALPVSVPDFPQQDRITIWHGEQRIGELAGAQLQALLQAGGK